MSTTFSRAQAPPVILLLCYSVSAFCKDANYRKLIDSTGEKKDEFFYHMHPISECLIHEVGTCVVILLN